MAAKIPFILPRRRDPLDIDVCRHWEKGAKRSINNRKRRRNFPTHIPALLLSSRRPIATGGVVAPLSLSLSHTRHTRVKQWRRHRCHYVLLPFFGEAQSARASIRVRAWHTLDHPVAAVVDSPRDEKKTKKRRREKRLFQRVRFVRKAEKSAMRFRWREWDVALCAPRGACDQLHGSERDGKSRGIGHGPRVFVQQIFSALSQVPGMKTERERSRRLCDLACERVTAPPPGEMAYFPWPCAQPSITLLPGKKSAHRNLFLVAAAR